MSQLEHFLDKMKSSQSNDYDPADNGHCFTFYLTKSLDNFAAVSSSTVVTVVRGQLIVEKLSPLRYLCSENNNGTMK